MPVEWSENTCVANLSDDPLFSDEIEQIEERLEERPCHVVLDLSEVTFVNSSNLAHLVGLRKQLKGTGCKLVLCGVRPQVWEPFQASGLHRLFDRVESVPIGLAKVQVG